MVGIEHRKETPETARNFLKDLNGFLNWEIIYERNIISLNEEILS